MAVNNPRSESTLRITSSDDSSNILCRYYMNGACQMGSQCKFSHDRNDRPSNICRYYTQGACSYGAQCRYDHVKPNIVQGRTPRIEPPLMNLTTKKPTTTVPSFSAETPVSSNANGGFGNYYEEDNGLVSLKDYASKHAMVKSSKLRADAKEFVPSWLTGNKSSPPSSYAQAVSGNFMPELNNGLSSTSRDMLCPYFIMGECHQGDDCSLIHGELCDLCNRPVLHPYDVDMNTTHRLECMESHEREMEFAFAVAKSEGKQCGICMETVMEKSNTTERRFGILPGCKHCFCLECIRKWRRQQFENKVVRACPECRVKSDFVIPSTIWVEEDDEKRALLDTYQSSMKQKKCKYFRDGETECPFGNKCFYRHIKPDGTVVEGDDPRAIHRRLRNRRRAEDGPGSSSHIFVLWDFFADRDYRNSTFMYDSDEDLLFDFYDHDDLDFLDMLYSSDYDSDGYDE